MTWTSAAPNCSILRLIDAATGFAQSSVGSQLLDSDVLLGVVFEALGSAWLILATLLAPASVREMSNMATLLSCSSRLRKRMQKRCQVARGIEDYATSMNHTPIDAWWQRVDAKR